MMAGEAGTGTALVRSGYGGNGLHPLRPDRILPLVSFYQTAESPAIRSLGELWTILNKGVTVRLKDDQRQCLVA
jgi:hypothetical protein